MGENWGFKGERNYCSSELIALFKKYSKLYR